MYIRSNRFTPVNSNFFVKCAKGQCINSQSSLILGENPYTVAGLIMNVSNCPVKEEFFLSPFLLCYILNTKIEIFMYF